MSQKTNICAQGPLHGTSFVEPRLTKTNSIRYTRYNSTTNVIMESGAYVKSSVKQGKYAVWDWKPDPKPAF